MADCTFVTLAGPGDTAFVGITLPHLLRMCSFPFHEVLIVVDDLPKESGRSTKQPDKMLSFQETLDGLRRDGTVIRKVLLSAVERERERLSRKYFGTRIKNARDHRGVPLLGWIAGLDAAKTKFVVHFDSDILLHQDTGFSWIEVGKRLIEQDSTTMFVSPLPGPPTTDGGLLGQVIAPERDSRGNFRFKTFSSRRFLVDKDRLENLLPTPDAHTSWKRRALMRLGIGNSLLPWEVSVSRALARSPYYRVHLSSPKAWSLHSPDHGRDWLQALPEIVRRVEEGQYPREQAGYYDLILSAWR
jgi:hypothetical protein